MSETTGRVANGVVSGLKQQPAMLALVVLNLVFLAGFVLVARDFFNRLDAAGVRRDKVISELAQRCFPAPPKD